MMSLLCLSPLIINQSFPRDIDELHQAIDSLNTIKDLIDSEDIQIVITDDLLTFLELVDWIERRDYPILMELYRYLHLLLLSPADYTIKIKTNGINLNFTPHPIPTSSQNENLVDVWSREVGILFAIHKEVQDNGKYFIGIACPHGFSGGDTGEYYNEEKNDCFPLVGFDNYSELDDAYFWVTSANIHNEQVSPNDAIKNVHSLGCESVVKPKGGSHYIAKFIKRSWPIDTNVNPMPQRFIAELEPIVNLPLNVIKHVLINGCLPEKKLKIPQKYLL